MRKPGKGVVSVAAALVLAAVGGGVLSRSLLQSGGASRSRAIEARVLVLFNERRAKRGLQPLRIDAQLRQAADSHSADMLRRGYFAHDGPQGLWDVRIRRFVKRRVIAEILSYGTGPYATPSGMVKAWMSSPRHRRIILMPELRLVGLGIATGSYRDWGRTSMATADFSSG